MYIFRHRVHDFDSLRMIRSSNLIHGVECDIRFRRGIPYLNHDVDPQSGGIELSQAIQYLRDKFIILNIKETGNETELVHLCLAQRAIPLVLDAPMPAIKKLYDNDLGHCVMWRVSEYEYLNEKTLRFFPPSWIWLDSFHDFWFDQPNCERTYWGDASICLVSPELQGRDPSFSACSASEFLHRNRISAVCTKLPDLYFLDS